jgi:3-hydroxyisobutyrate dehydrogenase
VRGATRSADGIFAHAEPSTLLMDTSTVDVETSRWCHAEAEERAHVRRRADLRRTAGAEAGT